MFQHKEILGWQLHFIKFFMIKSEITVSLTGLL